MAVAYNEGTKDLGQEQGHLLRNMVLFGRILRAVGVEVTPTQILDLVAGLQHIDMRRRQDFKDTARTLLVNHYDHLELFDRAFDLFWQEPEGEEKPQPNLGKLLRKPKQQEVEEVSPKRDGDGDEGQDSPQELVETVVTYSARERLQYTDFTELTPAELAEIKRLMQEMRWDLEKRRTRRQKRAKRGQQLDMRRTLRHTLKYGGEVLELNWRKRQLKRRPLVVICDISGSMERYARVLLKFIYAITNGLEQVESFAFGTRLTRLTRQLREKNIDIALDQATAQIQDWGGGTRIGESLKSFNFEWGRRVLGQGAIVLIISDGWDRGDITVLDTEMQRLQLSCQRLIWLNPLLGSDSYEPLTRGIQAALPYIDDFLPVHNLASLEELGKLLETLGQHRPVRSHQAVRV